ncbi:MAG: hypothetical protein Q7I99_03540 [Acholeplasmataceae bacterium]|nr:hypothetical protein [Acholeplasmataceae bacterium]
MSMLGIFGGILILGIILFVVFLVILGDSDEKKAKKDDWRDEINKK